MAMLAFPGPAGPIPFTPGVGDGDAGGDGGDASSYSYRWTVPAEDTVLDDGFKVTLNLPMPGMITISAYDLGVIGDGDKVKVHMFDRTHQVELGDWCSFGDFTRGVFCGSAGEGDELTATFTGPWSVD